MTHGPTEHRDGDPEPTAGQLAEEAATWFIRMRAPQVGDGERRHFQRWLDASARHRHEYDAFATLWGRLDGLPPPRPRRKKRPTGGVALLAALGLALLYATATVDRLESTKIGETRQSMLADGSLIEIDADSVLHVDYTPWRRRITLERGQARFKVAPGLRPFEVRAGAGTLRDIGTTFNVAEDRGKVTVAVEEGAVEISLDAGTGKYLLRGGQQTSYEAGAISPAHAVGSAEINAWLGNRWIFAGTSLGEVVRQVNRQHRHPLSLADASLEQYRVSGVFDRTDRAGLLKALAAILPLRVEETTSGTRLHAR